MITIKNSRHLSRSALNVERVKCGDEKEVYLSINVLYHCY